jgi:hypothetical protein
MKRIVYKINQSSFFAQKILKPTKSGYKAVGETQTVAEDIPF